MSILNLIRPELLNSQNYVPGGDNAQHRLHANELPWAPVDSNDLQLNIYPDYLLQRQLQEQLAQRYEVEPDQLVITRGSDDGIDLITRLFLKAGHDALMQFPPTFPMYAFYVRLQQAELISCPLDMQNHFNLSLDTIKKAWQPNCKIIMFCSPNNPTANLTSLDLIAAACEEYKDRSVIVVDEAYIEFANAKSATTLVPRFDNLIVLRTLSKACGLAGLRIGSIIAQAQIIQACNKIIAPYTLASTNIKLANQALAETGWFQCAVEKIQSSRAWLINELQKNQIFERIYPTETNFILIKTRYAKELTEWLSNTGIAIRDFPAGSLLHDHLRITVGNDAQNQILISALSSFINNVSGFNYAKDLIY